MTELKYIWLVILTGECLKIISSPDIDSPRKDVVLEIIFIVLNSKMHES